MGSHEMQEDYDYVVYVNRCIAAPGLRAADEQNFCASPSSAQESLSHQFPPGTSILSKSLRPEFINGASFAYAQYSSTSGPDLGYVIAGAESGIVYKPGDLTSVLEG